MLTDGEREHIWNDLYPDGDRLSCKLDAYAIAIERAVLAKVLAQQERLHKEWSELWSPTDEAVIPLTPLGESVAAKALELINTAKAMPIPNQETDKQGYFAYDADKGFELFDSAEDAESAAQKYLDGYREWAHEGWDEGVEQICWGKLHGSISSENCGPVEFEGEIVEAVDYKLFSHPQPAQAAAPDGWPFGDNW